MTTLRVVVGDASALTGIAALVVPANKQLTLGWGSHLAEKVLHLAGKEVVDDVLAVRPDGILLGDTVITSAGRMTNYSHLVHAAVLDKYDFNPLFLLRLRERTNESTLRSATAMSISRVHGAGLASLAFTPMGAGIGGMRMDKCARIMVEQTRKTLEAFPVTSLTDVVFAALKERDADAFRREIDQPTRRP